MRLLPSQAAEERPGAHLRYLKSLSRYISENQSAVEEDEEDRGLKGLESVEPEIGLLVWSEETAELVRQQYNERNRLG